MNVEFPEKLRFLFEPKRYKVARGGRGGAKSWGFARALLVLGAKAPLRVLCTREVQKSIKDSVHRLLADQIQAMGLGHFYEVLQTEIRGVNGTIFMFAGLSDQTAESVKSYEGIDVVWVEEAKNVSRRSWTILIPTIRKAGSEIWVSFNPELDTDETYTRFVTNAPPDCTSVLVNYPDNPWFPEVLEKERAHAEATLPSWEYRNIWLGECRPAVDGAIYAAEISAAQEQGRVCNVPYDPKLKVHAVFDLGWNDSMSIILAQRHLSEIRVIEYLEESHKTLDWWSAELKQRRMNWGKVFLPHDGKHKDYKSGKSAEEIMQELGWSVSITPNQPVESGIKLLRMTFARLYFDKEKTTRLRECFKRYRRNIPTTTNEPAAPVHDEWSHGADAGRYLALVAEQMTNDDQWGGPLKYSTRGIV